MHNKKRSKHHTIANARKRKKRNKQKFYNRTILPRIEKEEAKEKRAAELKKGLKKIKPAPKKKRRPQKKAR